MNSKTLNLNTVANEFKNITGLELLPRMYNRLSDCRQRKDTLFTELAILCVNDLKTFRLVKQKIKKWLKVSDVEVVIALAGYIYYIDGDFLRARKYFLKAITLSPENLDNWFDLAFALRHMGDRRTSEGILFHFDFVIYYYKSFKINKADYKTIRYLVSLISKNAK